MKTNLKQMINSLETKQYKVVKVSKTNYTLENGDVFEHTFDIDDNITVEEFQLLLDNAKKSIIETLNNVDKLSKDNG